MRDVGDLLGPWRMAIVAAGAHAGPPDDVLFDLAATVPGTAAAALVANGRLRPGEPLRLDDRDVWWTAPIRTSGRVRLNLAGLATIAEIFVDERSVFTGKNAFRRHTLDVDVREGERLSLVCRSPEPALAAKLPRARWRVPMIADQRLRGLRTPLLGKMPGWTPEIDVVGPTRALGLSPLPDAEVTRVASRLDGDDGLVEMTIRAATADGIRLRVGDRATDFVREGESLVARLRLPNVERWWPHTHGRPVLYDLSLDVRGEIRPAGRVGFRTLEPAPGPGFGLLVNGVAVFCRGAVFPEADPIGLAATRETYAPALQRAVSAGMNMLRVPGTMMPPGRAFFDLCDELGLLVFFDLPFANFDYPVADPAFRAEIEAETADVLGAIGAAPSLAVICGGSEVHQQATMMGLPPERLAGPLFDEILPSIADRLRPDVPFVPNSPSGGPLPFSVREGVAHYYGVGAYLRPLDDARRAEVGFAAECLAFSNVADAEARARDLAGVAPHEPRWAAGIPRDRAASWDFEDVREHYLGLLFAVEPRRLRREDPALWFDLSALVTGVVMAHAFCEWRRMRSPTNGALVYTLQDLAPGAGFGLLDHRGHPKPAWWWLRRVLAPVQVLVTDEGADGLAVHLVNETATPVAARLDLVCLKDGRTPVLRRSREVTLDPRSRQEISGFDLLGAFFDLSYAYRFGPPGHDATIVRLVDRTDERVIAEAVHHPLGLAHPWPVPKVAAQVVTDDGRATLEVTSDGYAPFVHLTLDGATAADDWFPLAPDRPTRIALDGAGPIRGSLMLPGGRVLAGFATEATP